MAIHVNLRDAKLTNHETVHLVPCKVVYDGDANVSKYFKSQILKSTDDKGLNTSFRGHPLQGQVVEFPKDYVGVVAQEAIKPMTANVERNFHAVHKFHSMTFWNWDKAPSKNDAFIKALDWIEIAEAIHSPVSS